MNPAEHAKRADELLAGIQATSDRVAMLSFEDQLAMAAQGGIKKINDDLEWTAQLAIAHALTSLAVALQGGVNVVQHGRQLS